MRIAPKRKGLSLIEVIIALTIFLFAFVAIGRLVDISIDQAIEVDYQADAVRLAQSKLAEVSAGIVPMQSAGETPIEEDPDYKWSAEIANSSIPNLFTVTVTISRDRPGREPFTVSLTQMLLDPAKKGGPGGPAVEPAPVEPPAS